MVDSHARTLELTVGGMDLSIHQSPGLLTSNRSEGTTGAVLWRLSPLVADWMANSGPFFKSGLLTSSSNVLELGCGISGILALVLSSRVCQYIATDQEYVLKTLERNLDQNYKSTSRSSVISGSRPAKRNRKTERWPTTPAPSTNTNIRVLPLDWELNTCEDLPRILSSSWSDSEIEVGFRLDAVIACDCIYNEALIDPFVCTCVNLCKLGTAKAGNHPAYCVIAQQLRSPDVFQAWLSAMLCQFHVWRLTDVALPRELSEGSGFVIHLAVLRTLREH